MKLLFIDFESQCDDAATTNPTEVGMFMFDTESGEKLEQSSMIYAEHYPPQTPEIVELTGITDEMLKSQGGDPKAIFGVIGAWVGRADFVLAHNANFDRGVYEATATRLGLVPALPKDRWICTVNDVPWAKKYRCKILSHLAFQHGMDVKLADLHRALDDVKLMAGLILSHYEIEDIIAYAKIPVVTIFANGIKPPWEDGGASNKIVKKLGFGWEKAPKTEQPVYPKRWVKRVRETELEAEKAKCPFKLTREPPKGEV